MDQILRSGMENASSVLTLMKAAGTLFSLGSKDKGVGYHPQTRMRYFDEPQSARQLSISLCCHETVEKALSLPGCASARAYEELKALEEVVRQLSGVPCALGLGSNRAATPFLVRPAVAGGRLLFPVRQLRRDSRMRVATIGWPNLCISPG